VVFGRGAKWNEEEAEPKKRRNARGCGKDVGFCTASLINQIGLIHLHDSRGFPHDPNDLPR